MCDLLSFYMCSPEVQTFLSLDDPRNNADENVIDENNTEFFSDPKDPNTINLGPSANPA